MKRASLFMVLLDLAVVGCTESAAWAQEAAATSQSRPGVPTFWQAVDTTLTTWSTYFQNHVPWWQALLAAVVFAYLSGLVIFLLGFDVLKKSGPGAAAAGMWMSTFVLFCFGLLTLPLAWPWWSPFVLVAFWILVTILLINLLSKKAAT